MATGDLAGNVQRLVDCLHAIGYPEAVRMRELRDGDAGALMKIITHVANDFSPHVSTAVVAAVRRDVQWWQTGVGNGGGEAADWHAQDTDRTVVGAGHPPLFPLSSRVGGRCATAVVGCGTRAPPGDGCTAPVAWLRGAQAHLGCGRDTVGAAGAR